MTSLGEALPVEMARVRDEIMPLYQLWIMRIEIQGRDEGRDVMVTAKERRALLAAAKQIRWHVAGRPGGLRGQVDWHDYWLGMDLAPYPQDMPVHLIDWAPQLESLAYDGKVVK